MTTVAREGQQSETIAQIYEGEHGELKVTLQTRIGPLMGADGAETTMTLPRRSGAENFGFAAEHQTVPLHPHRGDMFAYESNVSERIINAERIILTDPVKAKTLTLWYEGIAADVWHTNVDKQAITITHKGSSITEIPLHGTSDFFIEVEQRELTKPPIEWDIGDTHQGVIVRTGDEAPVIRVETAPADDREIAWGEYKAIMWVERGDFAIEDAGFHVWRADEAEMTVTEIAAVEQAISHSLSFMNGTWCRPKVSIAWKETWSDNQWWGTWTPVWGAWMPTVAAKKNRKKNWMPIETEPEKVIQQVLRNIDEGHYPVVDRYVHNAMALDNGDWISSVTASVAILERLATRAGFRIERRGFDLWDGIAKYLRSRNVGRPHHYTGWGDEAEQIIEGGECHDQLAKAITELRNQVTAHWGTDAIPDNAAWLAQQALYYVESAMRAELAPEVPLWDRTRGFHHYPVTDSQ